jgi:4-hydroxybenzoate polyprenyltransferase
MACLQFAIGALNDIVDAPVDRIGKPAKPIPAGLVSVEAAQGVAVVAALAGLALALASGLALALLGLVVLTIGSWYDLRAKGTTISWLPFAVGIPLLPVFGWFGAAGELPGVFLVLVPAAANAGTALAIANAIVDVERDEAAGIESIATALGLRRSGWLVLGLQGVVALLALATAAVVGAPAGWAAAVLLTACVPLVGAGIGLVAIYRGGGPGWRELAWEVQAVGAGLLAVAWLGALSAASGAPAPPA